MANAFENAAAREKEFHPVRVTDGKTITAWDDRARALNAMLSRLAELERKVAEMGQQPAPEPPPEPEPEPPRPLFAPRAYNTAGGSDARFCLDPQYGVIQVAPDRFRDQAGIEYDGGGRDLGGRTKNIVPELKPANEMDDRAVCDPYVGPTGVRIGGTDGYPDASFER